MTKIQVLTALWTVAFLLVHLGVIARVILRPHREFQFWCFVFVQQVIGKELQTFLDYPPMQRGASFNLDAVKAEMAKRMQQAEEASKGTGQ
jgi:hypothetical protein